MENETVLGSLHEAILPSLEQNIATVIRALQVSETVSSVSRKDCSQALFDTIH